MTDDHSNQSTAHDPATAPASEPAAATPPDRTRTPWRQRVFGLRSVVAVALAGLLLGAGAGTGVTLLAHHDETDSAGHHRIDGPGDRGGPRGDMLPPGSSPLPEGTAPEGQEDSTQQDGTAAS